MPRFDQVWTFLRPNYQGEGVASKAVQNRSTHPDLDPSSHAIYPFYRPESRATYQKLPFVRPQVLYIFGLFGLGTAETRKAKVDVTGVGPGGSGGHANHNKVKSVTLPDVGHLVPFEAVENTAAESVKWLRLVINQWKEEEDEWTRSRKLQSGKDDLMVDDEWKQRMEKPPLRRTDNKL